MIIPSKVSHINVEKNNPSVLPPKLYLRGLMEKPVRIELPTIFGMRKVNAFLFKTPVPTLIDIGENTDACFEALELQLAENDLSIRDIERVIITHAHVDHIGMANRVAKASGCKIWVSPLVYDWAVDLEHMKRTRGSVIEETFNAFAKDDESFGRLWEQVKTLFTSTSDTWEPIHKEDIIQFEINNSLDLGGRIWDIIHVPGHCQNQTCFYDSYNEELISADMILSITPTPVIEADPDQKDGRTRGLATMLESYAKIRALDIQHVYPGHYQEFGDPAELIDVQVDRIHQRTAQTLQFIKEGTTKFSELLSKLYPNRLNIPAANMLIGYLDLLEAQGEINIEEGVIALN